MDRRELYNAFLERFPIEKLPSLTLEEYTNLDKKDSFCYWLESQTYNLGSIWGGAAYKFGIFKYDKVPNQGNTKYAHDDSYSWYSRLGDTAAEAFAKVKDVVVSIANFAREGKYEEIGKIEREAVWGVTAWKIAFLYSNEQLLPIYNKPNLLEPIAALKGMTNAKKATIAELQKFLMARIGEKDIYQYYDELLALVKASQAKTKPKVWLYAPGENAFLWDECREGQIMRLGWDEIADISDYESREELVEDLKEVYNKPEASFTHDSLALWQFANEMQKGDVVYVKKGSHKIIGRGIVEGDYAYDESLPTYRHTRKIKWTHKGVWEYVNYKKLAQKTLTEIGNDPDLVERLNNMVTGKKPSDTEPKHCWWLVASPEIWKFADIGIGEEQTFTLYNENGNKRRIFQNFLDAKAGDMVIGYESTPTLQIVALGEIAKETDGNNLFFRKTEQLLSPIDYSKIKGIEELQGMECLTGGGRGTLFNVTEDECQTLMEIIRESNPLGQEDKLEEYGDDDFLSEVYMTADDLRRLKELTRRKKNVILQGAPGVGKTFAAKRLAYDLMGVKDPQRVEMVQFHQNYSYEDFIMGYKPTVEGGFELRDGVFYKFCKKAQNSPDKDFFFIIDEINRGNLSKIFGELLMLIENSHRDEKGVRLAYTGEAFAVPNNLYIIGMMNTADRSLAIIDYALRRRFSFFEMHPAFATEGFKKYQTSLHSEVLDRVIDGIRNLNNVILKDDSLGAGFCIGHSYFCGQEVFATEWLENVIEYDIIPMLREYWFDDNQKCDTQINILRGLLK